MRARIRAMVCLVTSPVHWLSTDCCPVIGPERYLRRLYPDPVTGQPLVLLKAPDGGILGVHSPSEEAPLKTGGFKVRYAAFEGKTRYAEWRFVHAVPAQPGPASPPKPAAAQQDLPKGSH